MTASGVSSPVCPLQRPRPLIVVESGSLHDEQSYVRESAGNEKSRLTGPPCRDSGTIRLKGHGTSLLE